MARAGVAKIVWVAGTICLCPYERSQEGEDPLGSRALPAPILRQYGEVVRVPCANCGMLEDHRLCCPVGVWETAKRLASPKVQAILNRYRSDKRSLRDDCLAAADDYDLASITYPDSPVDMAGMADHWRMVAERADEAIKREWRT